MQNRDLVVIFSTYLTRGCSAVETSKEREILHAALGMACSYRYMPVEHADHVEEVLVVDLMVVFVVAVAALLTRIVMIMMMN